MSAAVIDCWCVEVDDEIIAVHLNLGDAVIHAVESTGRVIPSQIRTESKDD